MGSHRPGKRDDRPNLTLKAVEGTIIVLDLDKFEEYVLEHGMDSYKPNIITGTLTNLVEDLVRKWRGVVVYGLDWRRGTEEAIIEIPFTEPNEIAKDLQKIKEEINKLGVGITIVALKDVVICREARDRREAYKGTPARTRALRILRKIKARGGNRLVIVN